MAYHENVARISKSKGKRRSLLDAFPDLDIGSSASAATKQPPPHLVSCLKGSFGRSWPRSMRSKNPPTEYANLYCSVVDISLHCYS